LIDALGLCKLVKQMRRACFRWQRSAEEEEVEEEEAADMRQEDNDGIRVAKHQQSIDWLLRLVLKPSLSNHRNHRPFNFSACPLCPFVP
jgi:hypothetical protein